MTFRRAHMAESGVIQRTDVRDLRYLSAAVTELFDEHTNSRTSKKTV